MLRIPASFTMSLDAVGDPRVESSATGPATLCAESSCGCKMPSAPHDDLISPPDFLELRQHEVRRIHLSRTSVDKGTKRRQEDQSGNVDGCSTGAMDRLGVSLSWGRRSRNAW